MAIAAVKIKLMPSSPEADRKKIAEQAEKTIQEAGGLNPKTEEEPIAFGLVATIILFAWPEENSTDELEEKLKQIPEVNSAEVIDIRRAVG